MRPAARVGALALVTVACGAQQWSFDSEAGPAVGPDADGGESADAEGGLGPLNRGDGGGCAADSDCPADAPSCFQPAGQCIRCQHDQDCDFDPAGQLCDATTGACVECTSDLECGGVRDICDHTTNACVECLVNSDCGRDSLCDVGTHSCSPPI